MLNNKPRTVDDAYSHMVLEVEELRTAILYNDGDDGTFGEAIDVILCALDVIFLDNPNVTKEDITAYAVKKLNKWKETYAS
jgi:hypothetical protein